MCSYGNHIAEDGKMVKCGYEVEWNDSDRYGSAKKMWKMSMLL